MSIQLRFYASMMISNHFQVILKKLHFKETSKVKLSCKNFTTFTSFVTCNFKCFIEHLSNLYMYILKPLQKYPTVSLGSHCLCRFSLGVSILTRDSYNFTKKPLKIIIYRISQQVLDRTLTKKNISNTYQEM